MATGGDWSVGPDTISLPPFAGPNDPAIVIGPDIPIELQNWVTAVGSITLVAVIVYRRNATQYAWEGIGTAGFGATFRRWRGTYDTTHGVTVTQQTVVSTALGAVQEVFGNGFIATNTDVLVNFLNCDISHNGTSMPRAVKSFIASQVSSAAIGAEAVVLTAPGNLYVANRVYEASFYGYTISTVASDAVEYQLRRTNLAGVAFAFSPWQMNANIGFSQTCLGKFQFTPSVDFFDTFVLTLRSIFGNATMLGSALQTRYLEIVDRGSSANYANVIIL